MIWLQIAIKAKYDELRQTQTKKLKSREEIISDVDDQWKHHRVGNI